MENPSSEIQKPIRTYKFWLWDFGFKPIVFFIVLAVLYTSVSFPFEVLSHFLSTTVSDSKLLQNSIGLISTVAGIAVANYFVFVFLKKQPFVQTPIGLSNSGKDIFNGFLVGAAVFTTVILISRLIGIYSITGFYWDTHTSAETFIFILSNLIFFLSVGLFEEYIFRAGMFNFIEETWGTWSALIFSSLFFGLVHLNNPETTLVGVIGIMFEAGIFLGAAYMFTRKIWFVAGIHWAWNYFQGPVLGNIISGSSKTQDGILMSKMNGSVWLTGGQFGPEAGFPALMICTSVGIYFLVKAYKAGLFKKSIL